MINNTPHSIVKCITQLRPDVRVAEAIIGSVHEESQEVRLVFISCPPSGNSDRSDVAFTVFVAHEDVKGDELNSRWGHWVEFLSFLSDDLGHFINNHKR
jgi:hypothetical protein